MFGRNAEQGYFPLDRQWQLDQSVFTNAVACQMVWLSSLLPYEQSEAAFEQIGEG